MIQARVPITILYISHRNDHHIKVSLNLIPSKKKKAYAELRDAITGRSEKKPS